jgi:hypothetical protein
MTPIRPPDRRSSQWPRTAAHALALLSALAASTAYLADRLTDLLATAHATAAQVRSNRADLDELRHLVADCRARQDRLDARKP